MASKRSSIKRLSLTFVSTFNFVDYIGVSVDRICRDYISWVILRRIYTRPFHKCSEVRRVLSVFDLCGKV